MSFDLKKCMDEDGGRCITRDGRKARVICTDYNSDIDSQMNLVVLVPSRGAPMGGERIETYQENGQWLNLSEDKNNDLLNLPREHEVWVNIYNPRPGAEYPEDGRYTFESAEAADAHAHSKMRIARKRIVFKEGDTT